MIEATGFGTSRRSQRIWRGVESGSGRGAFVAVVKPADLENRDHLAAVRRRESQPAVSINVFQALLRYKAAQVDTGTFDTGDLKEVAGFSKSAMEVVLNFLCND